MNSAQLRVGGTLSNSVLFGVFGVTEVDVEVEVKRAVIFRTGEFDAGLAIEHIPNLTEEAEGVLRVGEDFVHNFDEAFRIFSQFLLQCCEQRLRLWPSTWVGALARLELGGLSDGGIEPTAKFPDSLFSACSQAVAIGLFFPHSSAFFHEDSLRPQFKKKGRIKPTDSVQELLDSLLKEG